MSLKPAAAHISASFKLKSAHFVLESILESTMTQSDFIDKIHKRLSIVSVGASALRNQGSLGIVDIARDYFYQSISLDDFIEKLSSPDQFCKFLDDNTTKLLKKFPVDGQSWGAARKGLNLFFREVVYSKFISEHYKLPTSLDDFNERIKYLEVPLDFYTATAIYNATNGEISKWKSIKKLGGFKHEVRGG